MPIVTATFRANASPTPPKPSVIDYLKTAETPLDYNAYVSFCDANGLIPADQPSFDHVLNPQPVEPTEQQQTSEFARRQIAIRKAQTARRSYSRTSRQR